MPTSTRAPAPSSCGRRRATADGVVDLDYGRYDLNGDGYTGGGRSRINLDSLTNVGWTFSQRRDVLRLEVLHNENDTRDLDVLCHEAHGRCTPATPLLAIRSPSSIACLQSRSSSTRHFR